jgi:hypothetical protein
MAMKDTGVFEKLNNLAWSEAYRKDFSDLIQRILSKGKTKAQKKFESHFPPKDWNGDLKKATTGVPFDQFKRILKFGNISDYRILIPNAYLDFIRKWDLEYFFDPTQAIPPCFNPFIKRSPVLPCFPSTSGRVYDTRAEFELAMANPRTFAPDHHKLYVAIDVRFPVKAIVGELRKQCREWRKMVVPSAPSLRRPKSKYSTLASMKVIWEKNCKGKGLSKNRQARIIQQRSEYPIVESTIRKHYLPRLLVEK